MRISDGLFGYYKKKFGADIVILQHDHGSTWNDGGGWNSTIIQTKNKIIKVDMPSDYNYDDLKITEMKVEMAPKYIPK